MADHNIKAVFFDLDGTLIDSMPAHVTAWQTVLRDVGIEMDELFIKLAEGEKADDTLKRLRQDYGLAATDADLQEMLKRKRALYWELAPRGIIPEARRMLVDLWDQGVECDIVTGSIRANMDGVVPEEDIARFTHIITPEEYTHGKPDPDPYLTALRRSGLAADQCMVLENAPLGIRSARAAGLFTLAITTTLPADYLTEANVVISSYHELLNYV
ncbi:MAG TPA: HAD family phosphatase [bacterium]